MGRGSVILVALAALALALSSAAHAGVVRGAGPSKPTLLGSALAPPFGQGHVSKHGGPTMTGLAIHTIFAEPYVASLGHNVAFPTGYESSVRQYLAGLAADSGRTSNVFGVLPEYKVTAPISVADNNDAYGVGGTEDDSGCPAPPPTYVACLWSESAAGIVDTSRHQRFEAGDLQNVYLLFLPPGINACLFSNTAAQTCVSDPTCLTYHGYFDSPLDDNERDIFAVIPTLPDECHSTDGVSVEPSPQGNGVDVAIDSVVRNLLGMATDPYGTGWYDSKGYEIGDKCAYHYGSALTGTADADQIVGGADYWTQLAFNNASGKCYQVGAPTISTPPVSAFAGDSIPIHGWNLSGATSVTIAGHAVPFTQESDAEIDATMPATVTSGAVSVTGRFGKGATTGTITLLPRLTGFAPAQGAAGSKITLSGTELAAVSSATVGGVPATVSKTGGLEVTVPPGAVSGAVSVGRGTVLEPAPGGDFTVLPTIGSFTPTTAAAGTTVTVNGSGFGASAETRSLTVGGVPVAATWGSPQKLTFVVPVGAQTGVLDLTVSGHDATSAKSLAVPGSVSGYDQPSYRVGDAITILGNDLAGATSVAFGKVTATDFTVADDDNSIATVVPPGATTGPVTVTLPNAKAIGPTVVVLPTLNPLPDLEGTTGTALSLTGATFTGTKSVTVGGAAATFKVQSDTAMFVTVPAAAVTGPIAVTNAGGTTVSNDTFTVDPKITSLAPASATAGATVTVTGTGLGGSGEARTIAIGDVAVDDVTWVSPTTLKIVVPVGARSGTVSVNVAGGSITAHSPTALTIPANVLGYDPAETEAGQPVVIEGNNLDGTTAISFGSVLGGPFTVSDDGNTISTTVPTTAVTGAITVTTPSGKVKGPVLNIDPTISGFAPDNAAIGSTVTISGNTFVGAKTVLFGATPATFHIVSATQITAIVPNSAQSGAISVTNAGGTTTSTSTFVVHSHLAAYSPTSGATGSQMTFKGAGLDQVTAVTFAYWDGTRVAAPVVSNVSNQLVVDVPNGAVTGAVKLLSPWGDLSAGNYTVTFSASYVETPAIPGGIGDIVHGVGLKKVTGVAWNGIPAVPINVYADDQISFTVPAVAADADPYGTLTLTDGKTTITLPTKVTILRIKSISPASPAPGTTATFHGSGFADATQIRFCRSGHCTSEPVNVLDDGAVSFTLPDTFEYGDLTELDVGSGSSGSFVNFIIESLGITSFGSGPVYVPGSVDIKGTGFVNISSITFNGTPATDWVLLDHWTLHVGIPDGATSGPVVITTDGGSTSANLTLTPSD